MLLEQNQRAHSKSKTADIKTQENTNRSVYDVRIFFLIPEEVFHLILEKKNSISSLNEN